jgi:putative acetyltransferase
LSISIETVTAPTGAVRALVAELDAELRAHYADRQRHGLGIEALFKPGIHFIAACLDEKPAGCGGVGLSGDYGELKRMYVRPWARGRGVAQHILASLEQTARSKGVKIVRLETGIHQHAAIRFYEKSGFTPRAAFAQYSAMPSDATAQSVFLEKTV